MDTLSLVTDNITDLLVKILEFTRLRQKTLTRNIHNLGKRDFLPEDLPVQEFSNVVNRALAEHIQHRRLLLRDTQNIRFGEDGKMDIAPITDELAKTLLQENQDEYLELQIDKLLENSLNQKLAAQLLKHKQATITTVSGPFIKRQDKEKNQLKDMPME